MYRTLRIRRKTVEPEQPELPNIPHLTAARKMLAVALKSPDHPLSAKIIDQIADRYPHLMEGVDLKAEAKEEPDLHEQLAAEPEEKAAPEQSEK